MIPILFEYNETDFITHGIGDLVDCTECEAICNEEGEYELSLKYPMTGELFKELKINRLVYAKVNNYQGNQIFRIYGYEKNIDGTVTVNCQHISYDLANYPVKVFKDITRASDAMAALRENAVIFDETDGKDNYVAPTVTKHPQSVAVTTYVGVGAPDPAVVIFSAEGSLATVSYQWEFKSRSSSAWQAYDGPGAKTSNIPVSAESSRNGYQYRCAIYNAYGKAYSNAAILTINARNYDPADTSITIVMHPESISTVDGYIISFTVSAVGPNVTYQWQYRPGTSGAWTNLSNMSAVTNNLTLDAALSMNGYQYRCKLSNSDHTVYSNIATLRVSDAQDAIIITSQPQSKSVVTVSSNSAILTINS